MRPLLLGALLAAGCPVSPVEDPLHDAGERPRHRNPGAAPGRATPRQKLRRDYAWVPNDVLYPSQGCWRFTARLGTDESRITIEVK